jgi:hypothetical protein
MVQAVLSGHSLWLRNHDVCRHAVGVWRGAWTPVAAGRRFFCGEGLLVTDATAAVCAGISWMRPVANPRQRQVTAVGAGRS